MNILLLISIVLICVPTGIVCNKQPPPAKPKPTPPTTPPTTPPPPPTQPTGTPLGLLAGLVGTWVGTGFTMISLPDFDKNAPSTGPSNFRLLNHNTKEILTFTPIGGLVVNRGSLTDFGGSIGQPDIALSGLTYFQRVSDAYSNIALHVETGMWINVPETEFPNQTASIVRMASIPHGNSLMAQSTFLLSVPGGPRIAAVNSTPVAEPGGPEFGAPYLRAFQSVESCFNVDVVNNPNLLLEQAIANQTILNTVVIVISTQPNGGILNIPFVTTNADTTSLNAIFWIETVQNPDGSTFQQLQYTQTINLNFLGVVWPHITVSTLVLQ